MGFTQTMLERYASEVRLAVEHPFLTAAGTRTLSRDQLSEWLTQDRVYALCGYPKFIAQVINALPLASPRLQRESQRLLGLLAFALSNIDREVAFFDSLGTRYGLDLEFAPPSRPDSLGKLAGSVVKPTTRAYVDLLIATGAEAGKTGGSLDEALVLLWGMEKLYLLAWTHAKSQTPSPSHDGTESQTVEALTELITNWTMPEFVEFVGRIEQHVEELHLEEGTEAWDRCEEMFKYNLLLEQQFWPDV